DGWRVKPPSWRFDIEGEHDLIEEVGRTHGFDAVPPRLPVTRATAGGQSEAEVPLLRLQQVLVDRDYFEAINYSFVDPLVQQRLVSAAPAIQLVNPIADNMSVMRESLWPGLLAAVQSNLNRQLTRVRLFESGNIFWRQGRKRREQLRIGGAITGAALPLQWGSEPREIDFFDLKSDVEALCAPGRRKGEFSFRAGEHPALHPGMCAEIRLGNKTVGHLGRLHPDHQKTLEIEQPVYLFEVEVEPLAEGLLPAFRPVSRYPATHRDLAVIVDESISAAALLKVVREAAGKTLSRLELFDIYRGKGVEKNKKSLAFSLTLQAESSNLTAPEAEEITNRIVAALRSTLNAELRT
ncbi:MAG: phenylalanine--tRNA ligase subunit beta, partial [Pseudomonadota bacterium]|nr:phenylalanine--tRNA ligase subunit beta [Pseudomonadota bacterium]